MSSGLNKSPAYSGRISPADGLMRLISAMIAVVCTVRDRVTALKKLRGGSSCATTISSSLWGVLALASSTSRRLCSTISARVARGCGVGWGWSGGVVTFAIVGVFATDTRAGVKQATDAVSDTTQQAAKAAHLDVLT